MTKHTVCMGRDTKSGIPPEITRLFDPPAAGALVVITVGNTLRSDDGVGPFIAAAASPRRGMAILNAGETPEDIIEEATAHQPGRVVIIDAADFGGRGGEIRLLPEAAMVSHTLSTHRFPLPAIARILAMDTGAAIHFVGIQPVSTAFGEGLSPQVRKAATELIFLLNGPTDGRHLSNRG